MSDHTSHTANTSFGALQNAAASLDPVATVIQTFDNVSALLATIDDEAAQTPTALPRWSVRDTVAHMAGTERMLGGQPVPGHEDEVPADAREAGGIHVLNELHVQHSRPLSWTEQRDEFRAAAAASAQRLRDASDEELGRDFPSPVGEIPYREFMRVRSFDCYIHILDICDALDLPMRINGDDALVSGAFLLRPTGLGRSIAKRAGARPGQRIRFIVPDGSGTDSGAGPGPFPEEFDAVVAERVTLTDADPAADVDVTITIDSVPLLRLLTGRVPGEQTPALFDGDADLGARVLAAANTMV